MKRLVLLLAVTMLICSSALAQASGKGSASARGGAKTEAQIRQLSDELLEVEQGSLYPAVYRIEQRGWISSKWGVTETGRRAKFYTLTKAGSKRLTVEEESWDRLALAIAKVRNAPSPIHLYSVRRCGDSVIDRLRQCGGHFAVGAGRARIVRQLLTESLMLALLGGAFGILIGIWMTRGVISVLPNDFRDLSFKFDFSVDWRVLAFTLAASTLTGVLFGLIPAMQASRTDIVTALKDARSTGGRRAGLRGAMVVTQVALSFVLLIAAGLLIRTLRNARAI